MDTIIRAFAAVGLAGAVSGLAIAQLAVTSFGVDPWGLTDAASTSAFHNYDVTELEIVRQTVYLVDEKYVDPARIDWERMFGAALDSLERAVPACVTARESGGEKVTVEVGDYLTVLEIAPVDDGQSLVEGLREVLRVARAHVDPADLPEPADGVEPWKAVEYAMVNGMLHDVLDPHSDLLPPRAAEDMDVENQGNFDGVGISLKEQDGWLVVARVYADRPGAIAGLKQDDRIVRIEGESTANMTTDEAVTLLRGPAGKAVTVEVRRDGRPEPFRVTMVRANIPLFPVTAELLDGGVGYVRIPGFHAEADAQLHTELARMRRALGTELRGVILDLRSNPGGFYHEGWAVADTFLDDGVLVSTVDRDGRQVEVKEARSAGTEANYPLVVLVNPYSASASEIVAGALRNHDRAVILGQRSFGKGTVQNLHEFFDGSKLKLTVSRYLTPGDRSIQAVGIPPDIEVRHAVIDPDATPGRNVQMFAVWQREADLPGALDADAPVHDEPAYGLWVDEPMRSADDLEEFSLDKDFEIRLARDVILSARSGRRGDVLTSAATVIGRHERRNDADLVARLSEQGLDWSWGPELPRGGAPIALTLSPAELAAGIPTELTLTATNRGDAPAFRVSALVTEHGVLAGREFFFGRIDPGDSRSWTVRVTPPIGYPAERAPVVLEVRDGGGTPVGEVRTDLSIAAAPRENLRWSWKFVDADGDGRAEVGEHVKIELTFENVGSGPAVGDVVRLRNRSGKAVDILAGNLSVGTPVDRDGAACDPERRGTGEGGCRFVLDAGATWSGALELEVRDHPPDALRFDLAIEHRVDYDFGAALRAGLDDSWLQTEHLALEVAAPLPPARSHHPPLVRITHAPAATVVGDRVSLSGVATDDTGLAHVMVFADGDKVFHQGAGRSSALASIPFTADVQLEPGLHTLVVAAVDVDGAMRTESVVTWVGGPDLAQARSPGGEDR